MNPLYIDSQRVGLGVEGYSLYVKDLKTGKFIEKFAPRSIPYDSILIQRPNGFISFAALSWLAAHNVSLTILNWRGNVLQQFVPEEPLNPQLKIAQVLAHQNVERHLLIARRLVETKLERQREFLSSLAKHYPEVKLPKIAPVNCSSTNTIRDSEALYASFYFAEYGKVVESLGFDFKGRAGSWRSNTRNMHAADITNGLLNYSFALLKTYVRRAINAVGLENTIPFLHELRRTGSLTFDIMELWRTNCEYAVIQTLEKLKTEAKKKKKEKTHFLTDGYEVMLESSSVKILFDKFKLNVSMEEILTNCRIFAQFLLKGNKRNLSFMLKPVHVKPLFERKSVEHIILTRYASELKMNKSTLWYQKRRLQETGSLRIYNKTKQFFV